MAADKKDEVKPWGAAPKKKTAKEQPKTKAQFSESDTLGKYPKDWQEPVRKGLEHIATQNPEAEVFKPRGTDAHKSSKDKTETNRVVTVEGYDSAGNLIGTYHITKDARVKGKKGKKGSFDYI